MSGIATIPAYPLPTAADLPPSVMSWKPDPDRSVLLVHDMQRYFLAPFGEALRRELIDHVAALRNRCERRGVPVVYTAQPGDMNRTERGLLDDVWGPGMSRSDEDRAIVRELAPGRHDTVFTKWRYSAFCRTPLLDHLRRQGRDQLVVCGVYASVGVLMTAVDAFSHDIETFLAADAVADFGPDDHGATLRYAATRCARVMTGQEVFA
ncbi:isochorismatase family protein [Streptomyces sp. NPDC001904]|uniref:isochorismatase family protein n=1 Tax=Streptomyces sp. NPDC001904 TaxID=3154531 RepID=UPI0033216C85